MSYTEQEPPIKLVWAVLAKCPNGRSEVVRITNYEEADQAVHENPTLFYKSGPHTLN